MSPSGCAAEIRPGRVLRETYSCRQGQMFVRFCATIVEEGSRRRRNFNATATATRQAVWLATHLQGSSGSSRAGLKDGKPKLD